MIRTGLVSVTFRQLAPQEIIALVGQARLQGIEWGGDIHVPHGDFIRAAEVRRQTADAGLVVSAYGSYYRVGLSEAQGLPFERVLESAVALGAPVIRVWAGAAGAKDTSHGDWERIVLDSRRIATLAAAAGIAIGYEFHGKTLTDTHDSTRKLLDDVAHPNVYSFWQPPTEATAELCREGLQSLLPRVSNVHVFHWLPATQERRPLAEGFERWQSFIRILRCSGRKHFASLEFVRDNAPEAFLRDAQVLKTLCEMPDGK